MINYLYAPVKRRAFNIYVLKTSPDSLMRPLRIIREMTELALAGRQAGFSYELVSADGFDKKGINFSSFGSRARFNFKIFFLSGQTESVKDIFGRGYQGGAGLYQPVGASGILRKN